MSGSPVYIDGKLAGAVALGFPLATEAIAGIRPIEEMLRLISGPQGPRTGREDPPRRRVSVGQSRLEEIADAGSFSGFTRPHWYFGAQLKELGLDPRQGVSGGGQAHGLAGRPGQDRAGSMISVQLLSGDMSVGRRWHVTHVDGNRIYAFGHRFLAGGATELPFARSECSALLPNLSASFKIAMAREIGWAPYTQDRNLPSQA